MMFCLRFLYIIVVWGPEDIYGYQTPGICRTSYMVATFSCRTETGSREKYQKFRHANKKTI